MCIVISFVYSVFQVRSLADSDSVFESACDYDEDVYKDTWVPSHFMLLSNIVSIGCVICADIVACCQIPFKTKIPRSCC